jgi:hypothetical protein
LNRMNSSKRGFQSETHPNDVATAS